MVKKGAVDRNTLGERVFNDDAALKRLESIVHPIVRKIQDNFFKVLRPTPRTISRP